MDSEFKGVKLLCSLNLMHNVLPFFGLTDESFDLMMSLCSKTRKFWIENCNIFASITLNDYKYWTELKFAKEVNSKIAETIIKYQLNIKYSFDIKCESQISLDCMIFLLENTTFLKFSKVSIYLKPISINSYNKVIDLIQEKKIDFEAVFVELADYSNNYDGINYLSLAQTNNIKKYNGVKHIRELAIDETYGEIYEDDEEELIVDCISLQYRLYHIFDNWIDRRSDFTKDSLRFILIHILDYEKYIKFAEIFTKMQNLSEIIISMNRYSLLLCIPMLTKHLIEPKIKSMKESIPNYRNDIIIRYQRHTSIMSKLNLILKNSIIGMSLTVDHSEIHFVKAEMMEIDLIDFKYYPESQIILTTGFKSLKIQGCSLPDVQPVEMIEIMKSINAIINRSGYQTIMTIKLDPAFTSGLIHRLNSETLLTTLESNKKNGFTIETYTSFEGIRANLLIGATNVNVEILKETLAYFEQIHAYFTVFMTFKPKIKFDDFKDLINLIFGLRVVDMKLNITFLDIDQHRYLFSLFGSKENDSEEIEKLKLPRAVTMIQHLRLQTKHEISDESYKSLRNCKFLRTLDINSLSSCKNPDIFKELFLFNPRINICFVHKNSKIEYGINYLCAKS